MSIERSAELLRQALPWMSRQSAALHPVSYAVWFDYVARTNPPLRQAIDEHLAREGRLDEVATHALFRRHVADVDPESAQRIVDGLNRVLAGVGDATGSTGAHVRRFGASLAQLAAALDRGDTVRGIGEDSQVPRTGPAPRLLADVVAEVIADTGTMRTQLGSLQQSLANSRREIERLRDEVRRAREDGLRDALTGLSNRRGFDQALATCLLAHGDAAPTRPQPDAAASAESALAAIEAARASGNRRQIAVPDAAADPAPVPVPEPAPEPAPAVEAEPPSNARGPWLLLSDIDHFDHINDTYGRAFGEEVLKAVAAALRSLAPAEATVARIDGEAFALLLPEADAVGAHAFAEKVRLHVGTTHIRRPGRDGGERITLSLGLAARKVGDSPAHLIERAGRALRQAKADGRDRVASAP